MSNDVVSVSEEEWKVESETRRGIYYNVKRWEKSCSCKLLCKSCGICPHLHLYSCTCIDFILHFTVCKHIHLIAIKNNLQPPDLEDTKEDNLTYFTEILSSEINCKSTDISKLKEQLYTLIDLTTTRNHFCK